MAVERSVSTALFLGNVSLFLSSTASLYDQLGVSFVKMAQFVHPQQLPLAKSVRADFQSLHEDILSLGNVFRSSAAWHRTSIIAPLKKVLYTNATERDTAIKRYREQRQASIEARKLALTNFSRLTDAEKTAEAEIKAWFTKLEQKRIRGIDDESDNIGGAVDITDKVLPWEKSLKVIGKRKDEEDATLRLIQKLKLVQSCRVQYSESVEKENVCVTLARDNESDALSKAQKAEEDQINFFVRDVLPQVYPKDENSSNLPSARTSISISDAERPFAEGIEKKGKELLTSLNLFKQSIPYENGMGVMDADTLGLPEALGIQRDKIKSSFSARQKRIEVTQIVVKLFEEFAGVTSKSSFRMLSQITNHR
jgi:hypothetical protein